MDFYFLLLSLFFPRLTMIGFYFFSQYPANTVPLWADWFLGLFLPRILVLIYIYQNMGYENPWFWTHLLVAILAYFTGGWRSYVWRVNRYNNEISSD